MLDQEDIKGHMYHIFADNRNIKCKQKSYIYLTLAIFIQAFPPQLFREHLETEGNSYLDP